MRRPIALLSLAGLLAACGGGIGPAGNVPGLAGGDAAATITIGEETWELPTVACRVSGDGTESFALIATTGIIGLNLSDLYLNVEILESGDLHRVSLSEGPMGAPTLHRSGASDIGEMAITLDGERVTARGIFDNMLTPEVEATSGTVEADCGPIMTPAPSPSVAPAEVHGFVTVDGTTYEFTFGDPPLCNLPGQDGRVGHRAVLVDDPSSQVTFSYATAEMSTTGQPAMQIVINGPGNVEQLWYSAVGFGGNDRGSIDSITVDGDTVRISGTLEGGPDGSIVADFTAEATCDA
jgi:hypothetical protein